MEKKNLPERRDESQEDVFEDLRRKEKRVSILSITALVISALSLLCRLLLT